ncbi:MAG: type II secretion system protein F [Gammaproteobacteria bacterium]|nr:MAG: type II secretion system protein F [Gammaproteobacteria bacterium]
MGVGLLLTLFSISLLSMAMLFLRTSFKRAESERVAERLRPGHTGRKTPSKQAHPLQYALKRANIEPSPLLLTVLLAVLMVTLYFVYTLWGGWAVVVAIVAFVGIGYLFLNWRYERLVQKMVYQMPSLLDHMIRSLKSGRTLGDAMFLAIDRGQSPLKEALADTRRSIELGVPLGEAVEEFAEVYDREEFHILALGVRVNQQYGGNTSELLNSLISMIRDREKAQRQLRALTGETRISALVLAVLPISLAAYIFISNPSFLLGLWHEPGGQQLLLVAFGLQVMGCFLLWRMLKSI